MTPRQAHSEPTGAYGLTVRHQGGLTSAYGLTVSLQAPCDPTRACGLIFVRLRVAVASYCGIVRPGVRLASHTNPAWSFWT